MEATFYNLWLGLRWYVAIQFIRCAFFLMRRDLLWIQKRAFDLLADSFELDSRFDIDKRAGISDSK